MPGLWRGTQKSSENVAGERADRSRWRIRLLITERQDAYDLTKVVKERATASQAAPFHANPECVRHAVGPGLDHVDKAGKE